MSPSLRENPSGALTPCRPQWARLRSCRHRTLPPFPLRWLRHARSCTQAFISQFAQSLWELTQHPHSYHGCFSFNLRNLSGSFLSTHPTGTAQTVPWREALSLELNLGGSTVILFVETGMCLYTVAIQMSCLSPCPLKTKGLPSVEVKKQVERWEEKRGESLLHETHEELKMAQKWALCIPSPFQ